MFGLSFGSKKNKTSSTTDLTKNENVASTENSTKNSNSTTNTSQTGTQTGATTQQQSQTGATTQAGQTSQAGKTSLFSDAVLGNLESSVLEMLSGAGKAQGVVDNATQRLGEFDASQFVTSSVSSAESKERAGLDEMIGGISDTIGSSVGGNSMATLLASRAQGDAAARVEGVRADSTAKAQEILRSNASTAVGANQNQSQFLTQLLETLKGGTQQTSQTGTETQTGTNTGSTTGSGTSQESSSQQSSSTTALLEALSNILNSSTQTAATEKATGTNKTSGGGLSLSI